MIENNACGAGPVSRPAFFLLGSICQTHRKGDFSPSSGLGVNTSIAFFNIGSQLAFSGLKWQMFWEFRCRIIPFPFVFGAPDFDKAFAFPVFPGVLCRRAARFAGSGPPCAGRSEKPVPQGSAGRRRRFPLGRGRHAACSVPSPADACAACGGPASGAEFFLWTPARPDISLSDNYGFA